MTGEFHPLSQVEAVGLEALYPRVQLEYLTVMLPGIVYQPIEQTVPVTVRSRTGVGDEIIDIEVFAITQILGHPKAGHRLDLALVFQKGQGIAKRSVLALNAIDKLGFFQVRS